MKYTSKEEKKIPIQDPLGKWSDLTLMPEWAEEYCDVYTVKKYGKWVMCKVLKKEFADKPDYREKLEKEFDTRYNLAHPNIVMVNDLEEIPGIGMAIITDDAYGYSLRDLIKDKQLTPLIIHRLQTQLLDVIQYLHENHVVHYPITPENIVFTEYSQNLKLLNVGYTQSNKMTTSDTRDDIKAFGKIVNEVLDNLPTSLPTLRKTANKCEAGNSFSDIAEVQLALERRSASQIYIILTAIIVILTAIMCWMTFLH